MIFERFFKPKLTPSQILYAAIVAGARQPKFYADMAVPDTIDGRFDLISLHMFLVLERLKGAEFDDVRQNLTDTFFTDMDRSLREMGVGDLTVGKKVRKMAESFFGRVQAYDQALAKGETEVQSALARNVYVDAKDDGVAAPLKFWMLGARENLQVQTAEAIASGKVVFS
jgi:cytochrome b pre-mRNA-processing protein 3